MNIDIVGVFFREKYRRIHNYAHELLRSNPRPTMKVASQALQGGDGIIENIEISLSPHF